MDKKTKKTNQSVKIVKDRGDLNKFHIENNKRNVNETDKSFLSDRGDSDRKYPDKKPVADTKDTGENKSKCADSVADRSELNAKMISCFDIETKPLSLEERKRIKNRYTLKFRNLNQTASSSLFKKDEVKPRNVKVEIRKVGTSSNKQVKPNNGLAQDMTNGSSYSGNSVCKPGKKSENKSLVQRKPVVKTVLSKSDLYKMYKSVTFKEQQHSKPTTLQIHIPTAVTKKKVSKLTDTSSLKTKMNPTVSRVSVIEKPVAVRKKSGLRRLLQNRHVTSPVSIDRTDNRSPPSEVARWAPSINRHTKPYYEAWINTTLPTISRKNKESGLEKQIPRKAFQTALEDRSDTSDLFMNCADEKFTGKIKVRQRKSNKNPPCR